MLIGVWRHLMISIERDNFNNLIFIECDWRQHQAAGLPLLSSACRSVPASFRPCVSLLPFTLALLILDIRVRLHELRAAADQWQSNFMQATEILSPISARIASPLSAVACGIHCCKWHAIYIICTVYIHTSISYARCVYATHATLPADERATLSRKPCNCHILSTSTNCRWVVVLRVVRRLVYGILLL